MFVAGLVLALSAGSLNTVFVAIRRTVSIENILLSLALTQIPIIGKLLERYLTESISFLDRRIASALGPATFGLLSIPGGAVLSCPLVDRVVGMNLPISKKVALNIWFRHVIFFVYPLSTALIVAVALSGLDLITTIIHMLPMLAISILIGYVFYLRDIDRGKSGGEKLYLGAIAIIIIAPVVQLITDTFVASMEIGAFIGITTAFTLSVIYTRSKPEELLAIAKRSRAWDFGLIYLTITFYGYVFAQTGVSTVIRTLNPPELVLTILMPFLVGVATGRVQLTLTIFIPLYRGLFGVIDCITLVSMYTAASMGYLMSPLHPCLVLTVNYFKSNLFDSIKEIALPSIILTSFAAFYVGFYTLVS